MPYRKPRGPKFQVTVDQDMIEAAKQRDSSHCMIAEAIKAAYPEASMVAVDLQTIRFSDPKKGLRFTYLTPRQAQVALVQFDQGTDVTPFSVRLRGSHVTMSGTRSPRLPRGLSEAEIKQRRNATQASVEANKALRRQGIRANGNKDTVPDRVGGQTPPIMRDKNKIPMSRRREFGMRAFVL